VNHIVSKKPQKLDIGSYTVIGTSVEENPFEKGFQLVEKVKFFMLSKRADVGIRPYKCLFTVNNV